MNDTRVICEGDSTTVDVVEGGSIYELHTFDNRGMLSGGTILKDLLAVGSYVSISEGAIFGDLISYSSQVEMSGGVIGEYEFGGILQANNDSQIIVSGGSMNLVLANGQSQVSISVDTTVDFVGATGSSQITVYEGDMRGLSAIENSQVIVYGMSMSEQSNRLDAENEGIMTFYGSEFYVDSQQVGYGEITSIFGGRSGDEPARFLTVRFDNGEWFTAPFYIGHNASIVLTPEPSTLLLLGLGAVMLRRKRRT